MITIPAMVYFINDPDSQRSRKLGTLFKKYAPLTKPIFEKKNDIRVLKFKKLGKL